MRVDKFVAIGIQAREQALADKTLTPEALVTGTTGNLGAERTGSELGTEPAAEVTHLCVVVVTVFVTLGQQAGLPVLEVVVKVVLGAVLAGGKVAFCEVVHIHKVPAAQEVLNHLIVFRTVDAGVQATGKGDKICRAGLDMEIQVQVPLVRAALFLHILGTVVV